MFVGPQRVWLRDEDLPGLAMTRSIGDLVAESVGVTWKPGIYILQRNNHLQALHRRQDHSFGVRRSMGDNVQPRGTSFVS